MSPVADFIFLRGGLVRELHLPKINKSDLHFSTAHSWFVDEVELIDFITRLCYYGIGQNILRAIV